MVDFNFIDKAKPFSTRHKIQIDILKEAIVTEYSFSDFFGYKQKGDCSKALRKMFNDISEDKIFKEYWETYLRRKCGLAQCSSCKHIFKEIEIKYWKCKKCTGLWAKNNPNKVKEYKKLWYISVKDTIEYKRTKSYNEANRRAAKLQRTPKWADLSKIKEIYNKCPNGYHVDHKVPLQGKLVSGLHVEYNLQYLTKKENLEKSNIFEVY